MYGAVNQVPLPLATRALIFRAWAYVFKARLDEVARPLAEYPHLTAFFTRRLREGVRVIDAHAPLVSPCDGTVVSVSTNVDGTGVLTQVKGIDYRVADFLGTEPPRMKPGNVLFATVLYLSPGDYHRFHSPTEWRATSRTHIAGQLLPVNPLVARVLPSLFCSNERVAVLGEWKHGFISYTAVGATNVGSIRLDFDPTVVTNTFRHDWAAGFSPLDALGLSRRLGDAHRPHLVDARTYKAPIPFARGDDMGLFELGSTIVLVFEAPQELVMDIAPGDKVRVGSSLAHLPAREGAGSGLHMETATAAADAAHALESAHIDTDALPMLRLLAGYSGSAGVQPRPPARVRSYSADDSTALHKLRSAGFNTPLVEAAVRTPTAATLAATLNGRHAVGAAAAHAVSDAVLDDDWESCVSSNEDDAQSLDAANESLCCERGAEAKRIQHAITDLRVVYDALAAALL